jgi:two-component sensor histidine kinase
MIQLGELDLPDRLAGYAPRRVTQLAIGLICAAIAIVLRTPFEHLAPGVGPFVLAFPMLLIATLLGGWQAGLVTGTISSLHIWYFVLPVHHTIVKNGLADTPRAILAAIAFAILLLVTEGFRRATISGMRERDRQLAERDLFLREFDHRVKNNFAMVAGLLDMQRRRTADPATKEALAAALARVEGIARAHAYLYRGSTGTAGTDIRSYLGELCAALADTLPPHQKIEFAADIDAAVLPRDRAVSIGLVVNELVTNAAKHAFVGREAGTIRIGFARHGGGWRLTVGDDGVGLPAQLSDDRNGALGRRLVDAFARQADGTLSVESDSHGTRFTLDLAP